MSSDSTNAEGTMPPKSNLLLYTNLQSFLYEQLQPSELPADVKAYVIGVLAAYTRKQRWCTGSGIVDIADALVAIGEDKGPLSQALGDRLLWGMGIYPEHFAARAQRGAATLDAISALARRSYSLASTSSNPSVRPVLAFLADKFDPVCSTVYHSVAEKKVSLPDQLRADVFEYFTRAA
jgi:hypothetical protein